MNIESNINLREWKDKDLEPFFEMNSNKEVMEFFPAPLSREESDMLAMKIRNHFDTHGYGLWVLEVGDEFAGFCGLLNFDFSNSDSNLPKGVEIGWRLKKEYWGKGLMTAAAKTVLNHAFKNLKIKKIYSFTSELNIRSINLMERIGLHREKDFLNPNVAKGHKLAPHVLYSLDNRHIK